MKRIIIALLFALCLMPPVFGAGESGSSLIPPGVIWQYAGDTAPDGWLMCDGTIASDSALPPAFVTALGRKYNLPGDPTDSTRRPNFQGVFPKGFGSQSIGGVTYANASGTPQADKIQGHWHDVLKDDGGGLGPEALSGTGASYSPIQTVGSGGYKARGPLTDGTNGTPRTGTVTEPANVGVNFIIKK